MMSARPDPSAFSLDEVGNPVAPSLQELSETEVRASQDIQFVLQSANRLLWGDGFQTNVIQATRLFHFNLRRLLQIEPTTYSEQRIEYHARVLTSTLKSWTHRNQLLSRELSSNFMGIQCSARPGLETGGEPPKAPTLPTAEGCVINLLTAQRLQHYFAEWILHPQAPSLEEQISIHRSLLFLRDELVNVILTAEQLYGGAILPLYQLHANQSTETSTTEVTSFPEHKSKKHVHSKRERVVRLLKSIFGIPKGNGRNSKITDGRKFGVEVTGDSNDDVTLSQRSISANPPRPCGPSSPSSLCPGLAALPFASLLELEERQLEIRKETTHVPSQYVLSADTAELEVPDSNSGKKSEAAYL